MDDQGMKYRKNENNGNTPLNDMEFNKGDGGSNGRASFSVKTNIYSKQCHSDPENPGKMICKESRNQSAFDPFSKENNYKNATENVYTQNLPGFSRMQNTSYNFQNDELSLITKM